MSLGEHMCITCAGAREARRGVRCPGSLCVDSGNQIPILCKDSKSPKTPRQSSSLNFFVFFMWFQDVWLLQGTLWLLQCFYWAVLVHSLVEWPWVYTTWPTWVVGMAKRAGEKISRTEQWSLKAEEDSYVKSDEAGPSTTSDRFQATPFPLCSCSFPCFEVYPLTDLYERERLTRQSLIRDTEFSMRHRQASVKSP